MGGANGVREEQRQGIELVESTLASANEKPRHRATISKPHEAPNAS